MRSHEQVHGIRLNNGKANATVPAQGTHSVSEAKVELVTRLEITGFSRAQLIKNSSLFQRPSYSVLFSINHRLKIEGNGLSKHLIGGKQAESAVQDVCNGRRTKNFEIQPVETIISRVSIVAHEFASLPKPL